jgi:hypothetical protein
MRALSTAILSRRLSQCAQAILRLSAGSLLLCCAVDAAAQTCNMTGGGAWATAGNWTCTVPAGSRVPTANDAVTIPNNTTVTIGNIAAVASSVLIAGGNNNTTLTITAGGTGTLTITNDLTITGGTNNNRVKTVAVNDRTLTVNRNVIIDGGTGNANTVSSVTITTGTFSVPNGNVTVTGGSGQSGAGVTMSGVGTIGIGGNLSISAGSADNAIAAVTVGSGAMTVGGNVTLTGGANATRTADLTVSSGTITVTGGLSSVSSVATTADVTISTTGIVNVNGAAGVTNNDRILLSAAGAFNMTNAAATLTNNGTISLTTTGSVNVDGTFTNSGTFTNTAGGQLNLRGAAATINGTFTSTATSRVTSNKAAGAQTLTGSALTFSNFTMNTAGGLTLSANATLSTSLTLTSGIIATGANAVILTPNCNTAGLVTRTAGWINGNLRKTIPATALTCTFEVGGATVYAPVSITLAAPVGSAGGTVTASTTDGDHPNITAAPTPGLDPDLTANRYWSLTSSTTLGTPARSYDAVFNFDVTADLDPDTEPTTKFVVRRFSGGAWSSPTTGTRNSNNTQATGLTFAANTQYDFVVGELAQGGANTSARFNAVENSLAAASPAGGKIYTKLAGTQFKLDLTALSAGVLVTGFKGKVKVELLDSSSGGTPDANGCNAGWPTIQTLGTNPQFLAADSGRRQDVLFTETNAWKNVRVRITYPATGTATLIGCSSDNFSIRPTNFTLGAGNLSGITSTMTNTGTSGTPRAKAGSGTFTLTVASGLSGYTGTPVLGPGTSVVAHTGSVQAGLLSGTFSTAVAGTATGSGFTYSEVGNFKLRGFAATAGSTNVPGVYDDSFTLVDQPNDCSADFSNVLAGAKYGCNFGNTDDSSFFGRFYPASFLLTPKSLINRSAVATCSTTGTISAASSTLSVVSSSGYAVGDAIVVRGAGAGGADLSATILTIAAGPVFILNTSAVTAVAGAKVYKSSLSYTYEGESFTAEFTLTARNGLLTPTVTANYDPLAGFAPFDGTVIGNFNFGAIDLADATPPVGATNLTTRLNLGAGSSSSGSWSAGVGTFNATSSVTRGTVDGPFESFNLGIAPIDPTDNDVILSTYNLNVAGSNDHGLVGTTKIRFGRMKIPNAYGSELYGLPIYVTAQYWNGTGYAINALDSCTPIAAGNFALSAVAGPTINTTVSGGATLVTGIGRIGLTKPTGYTAKGSVDVATTGTVAAALPGTGRATFGLTKRPPVIYMRETY